MNPVPRRLRAAALVAALWIPASHAAVYRCPDGSFSDKPCGEDGKLIMKTRKSPPPAPPSAQVFPPGSPAGTRPTLREREPAPPAVTSLGGEGSRADCDALQRNIAGMRREQRDNFQRAWEAEDNNAARRSIDQSRRDRGC